MEIGRKGRKEAREGEGGEEGRREGEEKEKKAWMKKLSIFSLQTFVPRLFLKSNRFCASACYIHKNPGLYSKLNINYHNSSHCSVFINNSYRVQTGSYTQKPV
jgi:hypothetical protein